MLILKNLLRRKVRSALSLMGIAIGIGAIVSFNALGQGFRHALDAHMRETGAQLLIINKTVQDPAFSRVLKEEQDFVRSLPAVKNVSVGTFSIAAPRGLKVKTFMPALLVYGRTPGDPLLEKFRANIRGRLIEGEDEIMLGTVAAENLKLEPGETLELFRRTFRVVGVYESSISFERIGAILCNVVLQKELQMGDAASIVFVYLKDTAAWERVKQTVESAYPNLAAIRSEEFTLFYDQFEYIDWYVWIISLVSLMIGGLGVLNTMLMNVSERTREIGTLRAVGWSRGRVLGLILSEGTMLSIAGGLAGLGVGWAAAEGFIRSAPRDFFATRYSPELFAVAMIVALVLGLVGALYPAWQASRLSPIEALKYE
ncbi:MAG: ABC transporter permease [Planctomycetes bacterium]|nr:ABC transporter permease [Planctomycetota bacterium]